MEIIASDVEIGFTIKSLSPKPYKVANIERMIDGSFIFGDTLGGFHFVESSKRVTWVD